ncbi:MAG TPA: PAS domain-containing protein, partial [Candidatus Bathyarchaeia archaeon]
MGVFKKSTQGKEALVTTTPSKSTPKKTENEKVGLTSWNPAATRIFGYAEEEVLGKPLHDLIAPRRY